MLGDNTFPTLSFLSNFTRGCGIILPFINGVHVSSGSKFSDEVFVQWNLIQPYRYYDCFVQLGNVFTVLHTDRFRIYLCVTYRTILCIIFHGFSDYIVLLIGWQFGGELSNFPLYRWCLLNLMYTCGTCSYIFIVYALCAFSLCFMLQQLQKIQT